MTLSTVDLYGAPDARIVLVRGADRFGFTFFTNYESVKSRQLTARPVAAATFGWLDLHRQVRVRGSVERVSDARERRVLRVATARESARRVGVAAVRGDRRSARARPSSSPTTSGASPANPCRARPTGVAGGWSRPSGSSGRVDPADSTTASDIDSTTPPVGRSAASHPESRHRVCLGAPASTVVEVPVASGRSPGGWARVVDGAVGEPDREFRFGPRVSSQPWSWTLLWCRARTGRRLRRSVRPPLRHHSMWWSSQHENRTPHPAIAWVASNARAARRWARFARRIVRPRSSWPGAWITTPLRTTTAWTTSSPVSSARTRVGTSTRMPQSTVGPPTPSGSSPSITTTYSGHPGRAPPPV